MVVDEMKRKERIRYLNIILEHFVKDDFVSEGDRNLFLVFENSQSGKEVLLKYSRKELLCFISEESLTTEEANEAKSIFDKVESKSEPEAATGLVGYLKWFNVDEIDKAAEFVEQVFINVFKLPESCVITSKIENGYGRQMFPSELKL